MSIDISFDYQFILIIAFFRGFNQKKQKQLVSTLNKKTGHLWPISSIMRFYVTVSSSVA